MFSWSDSLLKGSSFVCCAPRALAVEGRGVEAPIHAILTVTFLCDDKLIFTKNWTPAKSDSV